MVACCTKQENQLSQQRERHLTKPVRLVAREERVVHFHLALLICENETLVSQDFFVLNLKHATKRWHDTLGHCKTFIKTENANLTITIARLNVIFHLLFLRIILSLIPQSKMNKII